MEKLQDVETLKRSISHSFIENDKFNLKCCSLYGLLSGFIASFSLLRQKSEER